jgi:hypothetical protein
MEATMKTDRLYTSDEPLLAIQALLEREGLVAVVLQNASSIAWVLRPNTLPQVRPLGRCIFVITRQAFIVISDEYQIVQALAPERAGLPIRHVNLVDKLDDPWQHVLPLAKEGRLGSDIAHPRCQLVADEIYKLQQKLSQQDQRILQEAGLAASKALEAAVGLVLPGMPIREFEGLISLECYRQELRPLLIISRAERLHTTQNTFLSERFDTRQLVTVRIAAERGGLIVQLVRQLYLGRMPDLLATETRVLHQHVAHIISSEDVSRQSSWYQKVQGTVPNALLKVEANTWLDYSTKPAAARLEPSVGVLDTSYKQVTLAETVLMSSGKVFLATRGERWPTAHVEANGLQVQVPTILELQ